jgi:PAS domain S-box-containing protein
MQSRKYSVQDVTTILSFIDSIPVAIIITNPDLSIRNVNQAFIKLTGFGLDDVVGTQAPYPWWPPSHHPEYLAELSVVKEGKRHKTDWLFAAKDGHQFWIKANVAPVLKEGKVQYIIACWTDITSNKSAEAALQKRLDGFSSRNA